MIIKVCGMREAKNIRQVDALGIDWMGFIFYEKSKRHVSHVPSILPTHAKAFGVFVNYSMDEIIEKIDSFRFQGVQLHGDESLEFCKALREKTNVLVNKAFGIATADDFQKVLAYEGYCDYYIFDTKTPTKGGAGYAFDWSLLDNYTGRTPFILSGGIGPESIDTLRAIHHPQWKGVDLNSKFETEPAMKNVEALNSFIKKLRNNE